jgi:hypothetical protein
VLLLLLLFLSTHLVYYSNKIGFERSTLVRRGNDNSYNDNKRDAERKIGGEASVVDVVVATVFCCCAFVAVHVLLSR